MNDSKINGHAGDNASSELRRFLQFDLGKESYAIHLLKVKEVIPLPETTKLPNSPVHYVGIMNLRGQIISIIDLRKRLKIKPKEENLEEAVVIVEINGVGIGLIVDSINKVLNIYENEIAEVPEIRSQLNAQFIYGVYKCEEKLTVFLDLESVLDISEIKRYSESA